MLGWPKPWATWAEFSVFPALSRRLDQKSPDVPSIWAALSFCEKSSWAGLCQFETNDQVSMSLLAGARHLQTIHHFWQKGWEPVSASDLRELPHTSPQLCHSSGTQNPWCMCWVKLEQVRVTQTHAQLYPRSLANISLTPASCLGRGQERTEQAACSPALICSLPWDEGEPVQVLLWFPSVCTRLLPFCCCCNH